MLIHKNRWQKARRFFNYSDQEILEELFKASTDLHCPAAWDVNIDALSPDLQRQVRTNFSPSLDMPKTRTAGGGE